MSLAAGVDSTPAGWRVVFACFVSAVFAWGFGFYAHGIYLVELQRAAEIDERISRELLKVITDATA